MSYVLHDFLRHVPCLDPETGELDHDGKYVRDFGGDADVIGGTFECGYWECQRCGEVYDAEPPSDDDFEDYIYDY